MTASADTRAMTGATDPCLRFEDVVVSFTAGAGLVSRLRGNMTQFNAVDHVDLAVRRGEILGVVGESGSGKTTICKAALGLHSMAGGRVTLDGAPFDLSSGAMQMVFQDPLSSLNPRQTVAEALAIPLRLHGLAGKRDMPAAIDALLADVGLGAQFRNRFPHELSGGQLQRAAIGRALATRPRVLFADEAVSKLDVSVRAQILNLLKRLRDTHDLTIVFVTHDLHVARFLCDRIAIMYFGKLLEVGPTREVYADPKHPYTRELLGTLDRQRDAEVSTRDIFNPLTDDTRACRYLGRCPHAMEVCATVHPDHRRVGREHLAACYLYENEGGDE
ncbi:ABC transporter ATP-binding protein [Roseovarius spongiae]|uniref:ABC transporter ATP-binding protein n=1 Tax=Roseovarius spongiae TaxID=2320272 RepID=A0A3A8B570_9RHOB|nr:oligopeptide/dipeptide ABC transporter ATP-binding protein [Roseovarius spongiae]RKF14169.1 ABC transporter ATP-binding protein [Roseovarius spongiae]